MIINDCLNIDDMTKFNSLILKWIDSILGSLELP